MIEQDYLLAHGRVRAVDVGNGPPLVLVHGLGGNWRNWLANIEGLAKHHRVIAFDLPGFGDSDPYAGVVTVDRYVDTVVELLDLLAVERPTLAGNSFGGLLTIETAARHPDRVAAAVLVASGGLPLTSWHHRKVAIPQARLFNRLMRQPRARRVVIDRRWARRLIGGRIVSDPGRLPGPLLSGALIGIGAPGFEAALDAGLDYDARIRAPAVACPTLVLWGREDRLLPPAMGEGLHRLIPDSRLEVWEGVGHCPMLENPDRFERLVTAFVAETAAGHATGARP